MKEALETDAMPSERLSERMPERSSEREDFANRKLIRPVLNRADHQPGQNQHLGQGQSGNRGSSHSQNHAPSHSSNHGASNHGPNHTATHAPNHAGGRPGGAPAGGKKSPPAETTHAENFYYQKQMQTKTVMVVVLRDGEEVHGVIEWYDRSCMKLNRADGPNLMIYKPSIKYMYKEGEGS